MSLSIHLGFALIKRVVLFNLRSRALLVHCLFLTLSRPTSVVILELPNTSSYSENNQINYYIAEEMETDLCGETEATTAACEKSLLLMGNVRVYQALFLRSVSVGQPSFSTSVEPDVLQNLEFKGPNPLRVGLSLDKELEAQKLLNQIWLLATQKSILKRETNVGRKKSCF